MAQVTVNAPQITIGYDWPGLRINVVSSPTPVFPAGSTFKADIKVTRDAVSPIATLITGAGLTRIDDYTILVVIPGTITALLLPGMIQLYLVRTDVAPNQYVGLMMTVPVGEPVTRAGT